MFHGTTILSVRRGSDVVVIGDGQITFSESIVLKGTARKVRRIHDGKVLCGFAGSTADAMTLYEKLEEKLKTHGGNLTRAAVELAKEWRTDRMLRRLEALLIAADANITLLISGTGDVIEPEEGVAAIGSGASRRSASNILSVTPLSDRNRAISAAASTSRSSCVIRLGTFTANRNSAGTDCDHLAYVVVRCGL